MTLIILPFLAFNAYVGVCTVQYMNKTIEQRDEKMKLLRLMAEHQKELK